MKKTSPNVGPLGRGPRYFSYFGCSLYETLQQIIYQHSSSHILGFSVVLLAITSNLYSLKKVPTLTSTLLASPSLPLNKHSSALSLDDPHILLGKDFGPNALPDTTFPIYIIGTSTSSTPACGFSPRCLALEALTVQSLVIVTIQWNMNFPVCQKQNDTSKRPENL